MLSKERRFLVPSCLSPQMNDASGGQDPSIFDDYGSEPGPVSVGLNPNRGNALSDLLRWKLSR